MRTQCTKSSFHILKKLSMWENVASGPMDAGKNSVIYMGLVLGPNKADNICGKTKVTGTMQ
jgi:hypothetical protein